MKYTCQIACITLETLMRQGHLEPLWLRGGGEWNLLWRGRDGVGGWFGFGWNWTTHGIWGCGWVCFRVLVLSSWKTNWEILVGNQLWQISDMKRHTQQLVCSFQLSTLLVCILLICLVVSLCLCLSRSDQAHLSLLSLLGQLLGVAPEVVIAQGSHPKDHTLAHHISHKIIVFLRILYQVGDHHTHAEEHTPQEHHTNTTSKLVPVHLDTLGACQGYNLFNSLCIADGNFKMNLATTWNICIGFLGCSISSWLLKKSLRNDLHACFLPSKYIMNHAFVCIDISWENNEFLIFKKHKCPITKGASSRTQF